MEQKPNPIQLKYRYAANYGLILGAYLAVFYIIQIIAPTIKILNVVNTISILFTPFLCFYLTKKFRDQALGGYIRFGSSWSFGIWLFFFAGLIMSVVYFVHFQFINPDYISNVFNQSLLMLESMNYPKDQLDLLAKNGFPTPLEMVFSYLFAYVIMGAILFVFISAIVARKNPDDFGLNNRNDDSYEPYKDSENENESKSEN
jgi:hypothetical protein